jgi:predicted alpha/beta hydrolase
VLVPSLEAANAVDALDQVTFTDVALAATDGYPLAARLWEGSQRSRPLSVALVNAGAGIGSHYYDRFARFLSQFGMPTLVYDYRGIAKSRPPSLRGFLASVEDWGSKDCAAALEWLSSRYP